MVTSFSGTYLVDLTMKFIRHRYRTKNWPPRVFRTVVYISSLYRQSFHPNNDENMAKKCETKSSFHAKPRNTFDERLSLYQRILEFEQKFLPLKTVENQSLSMKYTSWRVIVPWNCVAIETIFMESHLGFRQFCNTHEESLSILRRNLKV